MLEIRKLLTFIEHIQSEAGIKRNEPLRKVASVAVVQNPFAGKAYQADLSTLVQGSEVIGKEIVALAIEAMAPYSAISYGKAALVGTAGEQEHGVAMLTTVFGDVMREGVGGGQAWISSMSKRAAPGSVIDIPLAHKDALFVRSHYDGMTITVHDAPLPDEIAVIVAYASGGRLNARIGGLRVEDIRGEDGLR
jgi:hypothetical protein